MKAVRVGVIYPITQRPIQNGTILIDQGKIIAVGKRISIPSDAEIIDYSAYTATPGLIDAHTHIGGFGSFGEKLNLNEDLEEPVVPQKSIFEHFQTSCRGIAATRNCGFTSVCILPGSASVVSGLGGIIKLDGKSDIHESIYGPVQIKMALGENPCYAFGHKRKKMPVTRSGNAFLMRETMKRAFVYYEKKKEGQAIKVDPGLEAMAAAFDGNAVIHVHCHREDDILTAIRILEQYPIRFSIDHVTEGQLISSVLAEKNINCIVGPLTGSGPQRQETWEFTTRLPALLEQAGVKNIALTQDDDVYVGQVALDAGMAMSYGFSEDAAFRSLTIIPAQILGIDQRVGSLEAGKDADIAFFDGFPFSNFTMCKAAMINGVFFS